MQQDSLISGPFPSHVIY